MHWTAASPAATLPRKEVRSMNALDVSKRQKPELQERYRGWFCWFLQQKIDGLPSR